MKIKLLLIFFASFSFSQLVAAPQAPSSLSSTQHLLFKLYRLNYKPYKYLRYRVALNDQTCQIDSSNPLEVFYIHQEKNNQLLDLSSGSQKYFSPQKIHSQSAHQLSFTFKAFADFAKKKKMDEFIYVTSEKNNQRCMVKTYIMMDEKKIIIEELRINFIVLFGMIVNVDYVELLPREQKEICLYGKCPPFKK